MESIDRLFNTWWWSLGWRFSFFAFITWILFRWFRQFGTKAKAADATSRWNAGTKPTIGGMVFYLAFLMALLPLGFYHSWSKGYPFILLAGTAAFLLGLWDDMRRISAGKKMAGQILVAILFSLSNHTSPYFGMIENLGMTGMIIQHGITVFLVVALMNSVNMLDNMDGVATIATLPAMLLTVLFMCDDGIVGMTMLTAMGGFLVFNWTPSKVYMGDSGSMLLGLITAWMIVGSNHCGEYNINPHHGLTTLVLLVGAGALFIIDTLVVVINRLRHGVSPATGGRDHTTHNLYYLGLSQTQIALLFLFLGAIQFVLLYFLVEDLKHHEDKHLLKVIAPTFAYFFSLFIFQLLVSFRNLQKGKYSYVK